MRVTINRALAGLQPGAAVRLRATLMPPAEPALPGDYDFGRQAWFAGIGAVGYAMSPPSIDAAAGDVPRDLALWAGVQRLRQAIGARIAAALPGETGAIATALITGERGGISEATNDAFRDSGILHILSISGFHMAIMAGSVFFIVRLGLAAFPSIALRYPIKKWAAAAAMAAALAYLLISGGAFATVRSTIMISIMFLAVLLDRPALALRNVILAATLILVVFPESLFDVGFQMSFAAVLALVSVYEALRQRRAWEALMQHASSRLVLFFAGIVLSTLIASAAVAPFAAYHFHKSQQYAVIANLIALPVCNIVVMPAALAALVAMPFGLEALPLWVMGRGIEAMVWVAHRVAEVPGAVLRVPAMPSAAFVLMIAGGLWLMLWQTRWRLAGIALIAVGAALAPTLRGARYHRRPRRGARRRARRRRRAVGRGGDPRLLRAGALAGARRRPPQPRGGGQGGRVPLRRRRLQRDDQGAGGRGGAPPGGLRRGLPAGGDPHLAHRRPARLHGPEDGDRLLRRAAGRDARALHRGGRRHPHRDGGRGARHAPLVDAGQPAVRRRRRTRAPAARPALSSGASGRRGGPGCRPGRARRCAS